MKKTLIALLPVALLVAGCNPTTKPEPSPKIDENAYANILSDLEKGYSYTYKYFVEDELRSTEKRTVDIINNKGYELDSYNNNSYFFDNKIVTKRQDGRIHERGGRGLSSLISSSLSNFFTLPSSFGDLQYDETNKVYTETVSYSATKTYSFLDNELKQVTYAYNTGKKYVAEVEQIGELNMTIPDEIRNYESTIEYGSSTSYISVSKAIEGINYISSIANEDPTRTTITPGYHWYTDDCFKPFYVKGYCTVDNDKYSSNYLFFISDDVTNTSPDFSRGIVLNKQNRVQSDTHTVDVGDTVYVRGYMSNYCSSGTRYSMARDYNNYDTIESNYYWEIINVEPAQ